MTDLSGSTAIVTGGASGIGAAIARSLAEEGAHVVIGDLRSDDGALLAGQLGGTFRRIDVTDAGQVAALVESSAAIAPLRRVVCSAGRGWTERTVFRDDGGVRVHDLETFTAIVTLNMIATFDVVRRAAAAMAENPPDPEGERGSILTVASVEAFDGQASQVAYAAAKAGVVGMTLPLARDFAPFGIRINSLAPGFIHTPIYGHGEVADAYRQRLAREVLFPSRLGRVEEVARLALACLDNPYLNAESVRLDGGTRMVAELPPR